MNREKLIKLQEKIKENEEWSKKEFPEIPRFRVEVYLEQLLEAILEEPQQK